MAAIIISVLIPLVICGGIVVARSSHQKQLDKSRKTYRLNFPPDLSADNVLAWVRSISGTLRGSSFRFGGAPTVAFEVWGTAHGIEHRLKVPWQYAEYVVPQLRQQGLRVSDEQEFPRRLWTMAVEVGLRHSSRQLRIYEPTHTSASLLAALQALKDDETVIMQWVVTPAVPEHPPRHGVARSHHVERSVIGSTLADRDEVNDRRAKLAEPNFMAVLRVGAYASTPDRADHLIFKVRAALASTRSAAVQFNKRMVSKQALQKRIDATSGPLVYPMTLNAAELAALIAWPIGNPNVAGLPPLMSRHLPTSQAVPTEGRVLGHSNFPGAERPVALGYTEALRHVHVLGPTGVGKSTALANMLKQDMEQGFGVILIESKGDLFHKALDYIPRSRLNDVIVFDVTDALHPVGFNVLDQGDPRIVIDELQELFEHLDRDSLGIWTRETLYHGLRTIISDPKLTVVDLATLLVPRTPQEVEWADNLIRNLKDGEIRQFWQRFENMGRAEQDRFVKPLIDRLWQLTARPELRNIVGQSQSTFQMKDLIGQNKILLVNLQNLPKATASLTGTLLMNSLWHAVKTAPTHKPSFLYLDEFQDFVNLPVSPEDMLAKARGFGLGMVLAHQHMDQLPKELGQAIAANTRTKIVFQTSVADAREMAREFGSTVDTSDFQSLGQYETLARVATASGVSSPLSMTMDEPAKVHGYARAAQLASRTAYARNVADVEAEIAQRRTPEQQPLKRQRPKISGNWD